MATYEEYRQYVDDIQLSQTMKDRIWELIELAQKLINIEHKKVFVEEFRTKEGEHQIISVMLMDHHTYVEVGITENQDIISIIPFHRMVKHVSIRPKDYNFREATESSRLTIELAIGDTRSIRLQATAKNCAYLYEMFQEYIGPNVV